MYDISYTQYPDGYSLSLVDGIICAPDRTPHYSPTESTPDLLPFDDPHFFDSLSEYARITGKSAIHESTEEEKLAASMSRSRSTVYRTARSVSGWQYFFTLTFSPEVLDRYDYDACVAAVSKYWNRLSHMVPDLQYICVPELHKDGAYHFHALVKGSIVHYLSDSGHKTRKGDTIFNLSNYEFGFTTVTCIKNACKAVKYVLKYITKELISSVPKGRKRYFHSRSIKLCSAKKLFSFVGMSRSKEISVFLDTLKTYSSSYRTPVGILITVYEFPKSASDQIDSFIFKLIHYFQESEVSSCSMST